MIINIFAKEKSISRLRLADHEIKDILEHVSQGTDTRDLVIAFYIAAKSRWTGGTAYVRNWLTPSQFLARHGKWKLPALESAPIEIPQNYKLIRLLLRDDPEIYPLDECDRYHWQHHYDSYGDHLAFLFAHELHHYRRYHLSMHDREGEHRANRWALNHVRSLGYKVSSQRLPARRRGRRRKVGLNSVINPHDFVIKDTVWSWPSIVKRLALSLSQKATQNYIADKVAHFEKIRRLPKGSRLLVTFDPSGKYLHQHVTLVRVLRRNSIRTVVRTKDGKVWRWPMAWLTDG